MSEVILRRMAAADVVRQAREPVDAPTLAAAAAIVDDVRRGGEAALRGQAVRLGDLQAAEPLVRSRAELDTAADRLNPKTRDLLERTAARIRNFAEAQRRSFADLTVSLPEGRAGHTVAPVERAGCYAPGGRFPLVSSVLMTVIPARVAGVSEIWVASPRPSPEVLAAAAIAGADALLAVGGAQAIAALAFGVGGPPPCESIVGPGHRWVTAAKQRVFGRAAIDMLAGPSELLILADETADPVRVAADLLAQAEHDPDAWPILVTTSETLAAGVEVQLQRQLADLPTAATARAALQNGFYVFVDDLEAGVALCNRLAPEHLELLAAAPWALVPRRRHYGSRFIGEASAEVFGEYGFGPNHVLPTGGTARFVGGLSVFHFLRVLTWMAIDPEADRRELTADAAALARLEGLAAHARAAETRRR